MNRIGVLKNVAYAAKVGGGSVANLGEAGLLAPGALAIFNPSTGVLLAVDVANKATALLDAKSVVFAFGKEAENNLIIEVPRTVKGINRVNYRATTKPIITVGGTDAATTFAFENAGDAYVKVADITHSSRFGLPQIWASVYKPGANMTPEQLVDAVVAKLNAATAFGGVTAAKVGSSPNFGITITPKVDGIMIEAAIGGMWETNRNAMTTVPVVGVGLAADIRQMEKDYSVEIGNGNYIDYPVEHFSVPTEAVTGVNYDLVTIVYDAYRSGPVTKRHVSANQLTIATTNPGATFDTADLLILLGPIFGEAYTAATVIESGLDTGGLLDGAA